MWHAHLAREVHGRDSRTRAGCPCHYFFVRLLVSCASLSSIRFRISRNSLAISRKAAFWSSVGARFDVAGAAAGDAPAYRAASEGGASGCVRPVLFFQFRCCRARALRAVHSPVSSLPRRLCTLIIKSCLIRSAISTSRRRISTLSGHDFFCGASVGNSVLPITQDVRFATRRVHKLRYLKEQLFRYGSADLAH
jgi:hypothetical protein